MHALNESDYLNEFHTSLATDIGMTGKLISKLLPRHAARRKYVIPPNCIRLHPWREIARFIAPKVGLSALTRHETGWACIDAVYHSVDRGAAQAVRRTNEDLRAVYAYEDGALKTFCAAKERDLKCFYDLPIAYWRLGRAIHEEEAERQPAWAVTLSGLQDSPAKLARKDEELALADAVFCASSFTRDSLQGVPFGLKVPVHVVPYGAPSAKGVVFSDRPSSLGGNETGDRMQNTEQRIPNAGRRRPLKLLFVGGLSQRKGLSYLFKALDQLGKAVEMTIVGKRPPDRCAALERELQKHRYIETLPHAGILAEMAGADVFVFPSLFEGFGLVLLEAMSRGVPCITTPHTAGPDFMIDGHDGFIVPIRDVDAIVEKVLHLHDHPDELAAMKQAARDTAERQTWARYQAEMVKIIGDAVKNLIA